MTLGSGLVGEGITSDNVTPMNLIYVRKVGYGVRKTEDLIKSIKDSRVTQKESEAASLIRDNSDILQQVINTVIRELRDGQ
jgi:hypothetical protein